MANKKIKNKFIPRIPRKPHFRKNTYIIPDSYSENYLREGITDNNEKMVLFHITQFGGFRCKEMPKFLGNGNGFASHWLDSKKEAGHYSFTASLDFISTFGDIELEPLKKIWRSIAVNEKEMREYGFSDEDVKKSREFLDRLNKFYSSVRIGISAPVSGITLEDRVNLTRFQGTPFLVKKPKAGGRFFNPGSSFQRIASPLRSTLTINGIKTSEIDISAATLQFFEIVYKGMVGDSVLSEIISEKDPYNYFMERLTRNGSNAAKGTVSREDLKTIIYTAIYSSKKNQKSSISYRLMNLGLNFKYSDLAGFFPEFFKTLDDFKSKIGFLPHVEIFREESKYAQEVLNRGCLEMKIPILPVHDSFIVPNNEIDNLKKIMGDVSKKLYGKKLKYKIKY